MSYGYAGTGDIGITLYDDKRIDLKTELDLRAGLYEQTAEMVVEERGHIHARKRF